MSISNQYLFHSSVFCFHHQIIRLHFIDPFDKLMMMMICSFITLIIIFSYLWCFSSSKHPHQSRSDGTSTLTYLNNSFNFSKLIFQKQKLLKSCPDKHLQPISRQWDVLTLNTLNGFFHVSVFRTLLLPWRQVLLWSSGRTTEEEMRRKQNKLPSSYLHQSGASVLS